MDLTTSFLKSDTRYFKLMTFDFSKGDGLIPVIIQDEQSLEVLMLGYMNKKRTIKR